MVGGIRKNIFLDELKQKIKQYEKQTNTTIKMRGMDYDDNLWFKKKKDKEDKIKQPEDDFDTISKKLQQLIFVTPIKDIQKALLKLNFKGRMQTNKILLNIQLLQNFNTIEKMKDLINSF